MKRHVIFLTSSVILCGMVWIAAHRLCRASGEAVVQQRLAQPAPGHAGATALPGAALATPSSPQAGRPRSTQELARLLEEWAIAVQGSGASGDYSVKEGMAGLSVEEVQLAMDLVLELPPGLARNKLSMGLLSRWAGEAPAAALDYLHAHRDEAGAFASLCMNAIFPVWAKHDPRADS